MRSSLWLLPVLILGLSLLVGGAHEPTWAPPTLAEAEEALAGLGFDEFVEASYRLYLLRYPQTLTGLGMASVLGVRNDLLNEYSSRTGAFRWRSSNESSIDSSRTRRRGSRRNRDAHRSGSTCVLQIARACSIGSTVSTP